MTYILAIAFLVSFILYCPKHFQGTRNEDTVKHIRFYINKIEWCNDQVRAFILEGYTLSNTTLLSNFNREEIKKYTNKLEKAKGIFNGYNDTDERELYDILSIVKTLVSDYKVEIKLLNEKRKIIQELIDKCTTWEITRDKVVELEENGIPISLDSELVANIEKNYNTIYQLCTKKNWRGDVQKCLKKIRKEDMKLLQSHLSDFTQEEVVAHIEDVAKLYSILKS